MLNKTQIEHCINWLLKNASAPVKYLTYKNILNDASAITPDFLNEIEKSALVKDIFSKQQNNGSWCSSGAWALKPTLRKSGYSPVSPKYNTTAWILPVLANLGYDYKDDRIYKACEYVLSHQVENGFIGESKPADLKPGLDIDKNEPCRFSIILIALGKVGAIENPRVKKAFDLLLNWQREDGGWASETHSKNENWTRSCPFASCHAALALYYSKKAEYHQQLKKALTFLINHLSGKPQAEIQRFFYHGHTIIHELLMFSELKIGLETKAVNSLLNWLSTMYLPNKSHFKYNGKPTSKYNRKEDYMDSRVAKYRLFQLIEDDWLTYYSTIIFKNLLI